MKLSTAFLIFLSFFKIFGLMFELSKTDNEITLSSSLNLTPFMPFEDLPLINLYFLDLNLIHLPFLVLSKTS